MLSAYKATSEKQTERIRKALTYTYCQGCACAFSEDTHRPKQLHQCLHTLCEQCIAQRSTTKKERFSKSYKAIFGCPLCNKDIELDKRPRNNHIILDLIRILRQDLTPVNSHPRAMASSQTATREHRGTDLYPQLRSVHFAEPEPFSADNRENQPPSYYGSKAEEAAASAAAASAVERPAEPPSFDSLYPDLSRTQRPAYDPSRTASAVPLPGMSPAPPSQQAVRPPRVVINMVAKPQQRFQHQTNQRPMAQRNVVFMNSGSQPQSRGPTLSTPVRHNVHQPRAPTVQIHNVTNSIPMIPASHQMITSPEPVISHQPIAIQTQTPPQPAPKPILKQVEIPPPQLPVVPPRSSTPKEEDADQTEDVDVPCQMKLLQSFGSYGERAKPKVFQMATAISVSDNGELMVTDPENMVMQAFSKEGEYLQQLKLVGLQAACRIHGGRVALGTHRGLEVFDSNGIRLQSLQIGPVVAVEAYGSGVLAVQSKVIVGFMGAEELAETNSIRKRTKGSLLRTSASFQQITDVVVNSRREIVVLDAGAGEVHVLGEDGHTRRTISPAGQPCGRLLNPRAIAVDDQDNYYICDTGNRRLLKFSPDGKFSRCLLNFTLGATAASPGDDASLTVYGVCVRDGRITVTVNGSRRAQIRTYELP